MDQKHIIDFNSFISESKKLKKKVKKTEDEEDKIKKAEEMEDKKKKVSSFLTRTQKFFGKRPIDI